MNCPLCGSTSSPFHKGPKCEYERCSYCQGIFLLPQFHLSKEDEKKRYEKHTNEVTDPGYQRFVQPLVDAIMERYSQDDMGLDFGCGEGPVVAYLLEKEGYAIDLHDPLFMNNEHVFDRKYDYIVLSEVMEHFHDPMKEFKTLFSLLKPNGKLFCLTELYQDEIDFKSWYYKDDETHVFFYHKRSISYIASENDRSDIRIDGKPIIL